HPVKIIRKAIGLAQQVLQRVGGKISLLRSDDQADLVPRAAEDRHRYCSLAITHRFSIVYDDFIAKGEWAAGERLGRMGRAAAEPEGRANFPGDGEIAPGAPPSRTNRKCRSLPERRGRPVVLRTAADFHPKGTPRNGDGYCAFEAPQAQAGRANFNCSSAGPGTQRRLANLESGPIHW